MEDVNWGFLREDREELDQLFIELSKIPQGKFDVKKDSLKKRVARFCYKIVNQTPDYPEDIQGTCYAIAGFGQFVFGDSLDLAVQIAEELELPQHHIPGDVYQKFKRLKNMLELYVSK